jgi:two-component system cell cycle sensor histidine kinase/response regulator CckA
MESLPAVLIVDDDKVAMRALQEELEREKYRVAAISNAAEALQRLHNERFGIIMADQFLSGTPGLDFLRTCREIQPLSSRMLLTGMAPRRGIEEAIARDEIFLVLRKPWTQFDLTLALTQAKARFRMMQQLEAATREVRRQQSDLAALGRRLEEYRQQLLAVTAQPEAVPATVETEEIFRQVIGHLDQAVSITDAESNRILYLSPVHEQIWGRPLKELYENEDFRIEMIHPEDRDRVMKGTLKDRGAGTYDEKYRILRPDGEIRWIRERAFPILDGQQKLYRIAGITEDVSGRKIAREQLEVRVRERTEELAWINLALESEISERRKAELQLRETNQRLQKTLEELPSTRQEETETLESVDLLGSKMPQSRD